MNSIENSPFTLTFPSIEVALASLGQKVFGATIVIAAPPAPANLPPLPLAPDIALHRSHLAALAQDQALVEARRERDDAAADAIAQREEAKRLVAQIKDLTDQRNGLFSANEDLTRERDILAEWKRQGLIVIGKWDEVTAYVRQHPDTDIGQYVWDDVLKWLKERDELKKWKADVKAQFRM